MVSGLVDNKEKRCPVCGGSVAEDDIYCEHCGAPLTFFEEDIAEPLRDLEDVISEEEPVLVCGECGALVKSTDTTCPECGVLLEDAEVSEEGKPTTSPVPVTDAMFLCPECGAFVKENDDVCEICGTRLTMDRKIGVGEFAAREKKREVCEVCGAYLDEETGECAICQSKAKSEVPPSEELESVESELDNLLSDLEALEEVEVAEVEEITPEVKAEAREKPVPTLKKGAVTAPLPRTVRRVRPSSIIEVKRSQEFVVYSTLIAVGLFYTASQFDLYLHNWLMVLVFGALFGTGTALLLDGRGALGGETLKRNAVFSIGGVILLSVPLLYFLSFRLDLYNIGMIMAILGIAVSFLGIALAGRHSPPYLVWAFGSGLLFLMSFSQIGVLPPVTLEVSYALWLASFALIVMSAGLILRMKWMQLLLDSQVLLGDKRYRERQMRESITSYDKAIQASNALRESGGWGTNLDVPWYSKGAALIILGKYEEALECIDNALKISPHNEVALVSKGTALSRLDRHREALRCYNEAIRINPRYEVAWNNKGNALARLGKHEEALKCYERAIELDPEYKEAWVNKGYVLAKMGDYDAAARCADAVSRSATMSS